MMIEGFGIINIHDGQTDTRFGSQADLLTDSSLKVLKIRGRTELIAVG
jgi:hypothetical protein